MRHSSLLMRARSPLALVCLAALVLSACANPDPEQLNRAAQVILTQSAAEGGSLERATTDPNAPTPTIGVVTATPSLIYALCVLRNEAQLRPEPVDSAPVAAELNARDVMTAYGRTTDALWVLGWNKDETYGWVTADAVGCTVPIAELYPTDSRVLLTEPVAVAAAQQPTPTLESAATASPTQAPAATEAPAATPTEAPAETPTAALTEAPAETPTATPIDAPAETPTETPTEAPAETPPATPAEAAATPAPAAQQPEIITQIITVTVVVTVTATPAIATEAPTTAPTTAPTSTPTAAAEATATPEPTVTVSGATPVAAAGTPAPFDLECVVTPGTPVNLRRGPARTERLIGALPEGTNFVAFGRNEDATWLYGATPRRTFGWLIASAVACQGDVGRLPVVDR